MKKLYLASILCTFSSFAMEKNKEIQSFEHFQNETQKEFPNFFSYFGQWGKYCVNKMFPIILDRLAIPQVEGNDVVLKTGYFNKIQKIASEYNATAYVAGGVVRAILGYIYQELYDAYQSSPTTWGNINSFTSQDEYFQAFVAKWIENHPTLDNLEVLGIGSDCDILIDGYDKEKQNELKDKIRDFMNGAEVQLGLRDNQSVFKKVIFPVADVKDYFDQIKRTIDQGGSTSDWMAFPLTAIEGKREIREPKGYSIFENFLEGKLEYLKGDAESSDKQSIRGLRPLIEWPFIELKGKEILIKELSKFNDLSEDAKEQNVKMKRNDLSEDAKEQIMKMKRNARFQAGHNRLLKEEKFKDLDVIQNNVPTFVQHEDLDHREVKNIKGVELLPVTDFINQYTDQGKLYHGTPDKANLVAMIRGGFVFSTGKAGTKAECGGGFYTTKDLSTAQGFAKGDGVVLNFRIKNNENIRILDLNKKNHKEFYDELSGNHENLKDKHNIDIIINNHDDEKIRYPIILNESVIEKNDLKQMVQDIREFALSGALNVDLDGLISLKNLGFEKEQIKNYLKMFSKFDVKIEKFIPLIKNKMSLEEIESFLKCFFHPHHAEDINLSDVLTIKKIIKYINNSYPEDIINVLEEITEKQEEKLNILIDNNVIDKISSTSFKKAIHVLQNTSEENIINLIKLRKEGIIQKFDNSWMFTTGINPFEIFNNDTTEKLIEFNIKNIPYILLNFVKIEKGLILEALKQM